MFDPEGAPQRWLAPAAAVTLAGVLSLGCSASDSDSVAAGDVEAASSDCGRAATTAYQNTIEYWGESGDINAQFPEAEPTKVKFEELWGTQ